VARADGHRVANLPQWVTRGIGANIERELSELAHHHMHTGLVTLVVGMLVSAGIAGNVSGVLRPPSSLEPSPQPKSSKRAVSVSHRSQRVRKCDALKTGEELSCTPELEDTDSATAVTFRQVAVPDSTAGGASGPVIVAFPSHVGLQEQNTELALGQWDVDWPGARGLKRLQLDAHSELSIALKTTSGRCEVHRAQCRLVGGVVSRRVAVTDGEH